MAGTPERPRIAPLPPAEWPDAMRGALAAIRPAEPRHPFPPRDPDRPKGLNVLGTFARHPQLATAFHTFNGHVLFSTTLTPRRRELLVLRVATVRGCAYEWAQHAILAGDTGITPDELEQIVVGPGAPEWTPLDGALLRATDELLAHAEIADATWATLATELDEQQLMDVVFTVGAYNLLAMALKSFRVELDEDLRKPASP